MLFICLDWVRMLVEFPGCTNINTILFRCQKGGTKNANLSEVAKCGSNTKIM